MSNADAEQVRFLAAFEPTVRVCVVVDAFHFAGRDFYYHDDHDVPAEMAAVLLDKGYVRLAKERTAHDRESLLK